MPVFNGEKYLIEAIESILNQTYRNFEFIIVNDASTDGSIKIINKYSKEDDRIKIISNPENLGIAGATNKGISHSNGEYIALMDQDDISLHERLEKEVGFLDENAEIMVVGANSIRLDEKGNLYKRRAVFETPPLIRWGLLFANQIQNPTVLMRRILFTKYGFRYENYMPSQDYRLWLQICQYFKLANLQENLLIHRIHSESASLRMNELFSIKAQEMKKDFVRKNLNYDISNNVVLALSNQSQFLSIEDAILTCKIIIKWMNNNKRGISKSNKTYINQKTSRKIRNIWYLQNKNFRLFPYVFYSLLLR